MNSTQWKTRLARLSCLVSILFVTAVGSLAQAALPNPVLMFVGQEPYQANGKSYIRYRYAVDNLAAYPNTLFAVAPTLPPCGSNTRASRTWVDIYDQTGKRLYGFCALGNNQDLGKLWFALEDGVIPPSWIYIEMNDRQNQVKYKSGLSETTQ